MQPHLGMALPGINRSGYFASYNANKMGITVDMRAPQSPGTDAADGKMGPSGYRELHPRHHGKLGSLASDQLKEVNPGLVMFSTSMMGRGGPMERQPGFGPVLSSLVGLTNLTGWPDRDPVNPLRRVHRLYCPSVRRSSHSGRSGPQPPHRRGAST